ncbi:DoxX family protein [Nocardia sp. NPDC055049]
MFSLTSPSSERPSQRFTRLALGGVMSVAGVSHLTFARSDFQAQVPDWFPLDADLTVLGSGVAEIGFGLALLGLPRKRRITGIALAAFFIAIFPGNIAQYVEGTTAFGLDTDAKRLLRLFGQPALIAAALWAAGLPERAEFNQK